MDRVGINRRGLTFDEGKPFLHVAGEGFHQAARLFVFVEVDDEIEVRSLQVGEKDGVQRKHDINDAGHNLR